jgi:Ran GTPase-activating protein (RanGAP) involved in mRNA processing and transport
VTRSQLRTLLRIPFNQLSRLNLSRCRLGADAVRHLAQSDLVAQLHALILRGNAFHDQGVENLLSWANLDALRVLDLGECSLGAASAALLGATSFPGLTHLVLPGNYFGDASCAELLRNVGLRNLVELDLSECGAGQESADVLGLSTPLTALRKLSLSGCSFQHTHLFSLLASPRLDRLESINLADLYLLWDEESWQEPAKMPTTPLDVDLSALRGNDDPVGELLGRPLARRLGRLRLGQTGDTATLLETLNTSEHLTALRGLELTGRYLDADERHGLLGCPRLEQLTSLVLDDCALTDEGVIHLAWSPRLRNLTRLSLRGCRCGADGAKALAQSPYLTNLRHLDLRDNSIGDEGAVALAQTAHLSNPVVLDVANCGIGEEGTTALLRAAAMHFARPVTLPVDLL